MVVIEELLDFSQLETDRLAIVTGPFEVPAVIEHVVDRMQAQAKRKGLALTAEVAPRLPRLVGAEARLSQVLGQLVDNAIKFTDEGAVTVRVLAPWVGPEEATISFEVRDTGIGFDESEKDRIFEAFSQADSSLTRTHGGSGLGLSVAAGLVELMGGRLDAQSTPGHGSVFSFELTLPVSEEVTADAPRPPAEEALHVLLVDDNRVNRVLTEALLSKRGYSVTVAGTGSEAVDFFRAALFDVVLMDIEMPGMDGLEATRAMRRLERERERRTPIIALTAHSSRGSREECLKAGMDEYLTVPADGDTLDAAIRAHTVMQATDFERGRALGLVDGDRGAAAEAASALVVDGREDLVAMRQAADMRDSMTMARSAEHLESLAEGISANRLRDIAHRVAVLARQGRTEEAAALLAEVDDAYRRGVESVSRGFDVA
jgi:CheY-like chemotaxis protein